MNLHLLALVVAFASGMTMAIQGTLNSILGKTTGLWEATFVVHVVGLVFVGLLLYPIGLGDGSIAKVFSAPWYTWLGGILGGLIVYGVARSIPKLGVANATTAIIVGQTLTAALLDHFGAGGTEPIPFSVQRVLGILLLAGGGWLLLKR